MLWNGRGIIDLEFEVPTAKRLSPRGFKRFLAGLTPSPTDVFQRVASSLDAFVSFDDSSNEQQSICELVACWTIGTYFCDAFHVVGYLWPNGERGSGKTQLLNAITTLAYLGKTVTSGSSFASIRDEAHYGATIAFDDCENIKDLDNNKRELLLTGNTRGASITLKESAGDNVWRNKSINCFAPRCFSAIKLPDPVLDSRTIRLPMVASTDKSKTRRSPSRKDDWPFDVPTLVDDLWMIGVMFLKRVHQCDREAAEMTPLFGRSHDIFRMPLAIAYWLESDHGCDGLFRRVSALAESHQGMKLEADGLDALAMTLVTVAELLAGRHVASVSSKGVANHLYNLALQEEALEIAEFATSTQRVATMLRNLGFKKDPSHRSARSWQLTQDRLQESAASRGVTLPAFEPNEPKMLPVE